jgi:4-amino-4-deoxy-L-arabinose transferase-like glycosyltransferase
VIAPPSARRDFTVLALLAALVFLPGLGRRDVWNPDEARYAEVAREMRDAGSWAIPLLNGQVYTQKPPLLFWSIAAFGALRGGIDETAARLPSALSAIGTVLLVFALGRRLFDRRAAFLAALVFGTSLKILWQGRFGQIDMLLTFLVTLGVWFWVRAQTEERRALSLLFYLCAGLATLAKGPVGLLPPLLSIVAFLLLERDREGLRRLRVPLGLLVWLAVVLAWLIPAYFAGGESYFRQIAFKQTVTRYANPWHHFAPWYYYLTVLPANFFPWSFFLPSAVLVAWKRATDLDPKVKRGLRFALCWVVVTIVFFSLSPAKRDVYILTMFPGLALFTGAALSHLAGSWPRDRKWLTVPFGLVAALFALIVAALPVVGILGKGKAEAVPLGGDRFVWEVTLAFLPALVGALWAFFASRRGGGGGVRAAGALAGGVALTALVASSWLMPKMDVVKSARGLSRVLFTQAKDGEPYGIYPRLDSTFLFYTRRFAADLQSPEELRSFLSRPSPTGRIWLLVQRDDFGKVAPTLPELRSLREVARDADPKSGYLLLTRP